MLGWVVHQAIAIASCYREEGSLLVVCPASMRNVWADELERWLPYLSPLDVHLGTFLSPRIGH
jgi:SNF2 family DNA or RNA helicase